MEDSGLLINRRHFFRAGWVWRWWDCVGVAARLVANQRSGVAGHGKWPGAHPGQPGATHFPAAAKRVIYLFMAGGPSQMDLLDYKPELSRTFRQGSADSIRMGQRITTMTSGQAGSPVRPTKFKFLPSPTR